MTLPDAYGWTQHEANEQQRTKKLEERSNQNAAMRARLARKNNFDFWMTMPVPTKAMPFRRSPMPTMPTGILLRI